MASKKTGKRVKFFLFLLLILGVVIAAVAALRSSSFAVLNPKGEVAQQERNLLIFGTLLSLFVVLPVFAMTIFIAWKYRAGNKRAKYRPDWNHSAIAETVWWVVPIILITILSVITWRTSHALDPYRPLVSDKQPLTIQVVALDWKWLFLYPEQQIASLNYVQFPAGTPVNFEITADAPMNSFWIPELGGQIYAMPGMSTQLHLMAADTGDFNGSSANISGQGFAGMKFIARASSQADYESWINSVRQSPRQLMQEDYDNLAKPSESNPVAYFSAVEPGLYSKIEMKYMGSGHDMAGTAAR
jgi:cytochrome o ubiquinol oxidase subunit 2